MTTAFQANAFQVNAFQIDVAAAAASASTGSGGYFRWDSKNRRVVSWRPGDEDLSAQRIRRLSELDPAPLFTPEDVVVAGPDIDPATLQAMAIDAYVRSQEEIGRRLEQQRRAKLLAAIEDDEDNFMVM